jgi:predicted ATPase
VVICDNDSIHHARKVTAYLKQQPRLELLYGARARQADPEFVLDAQTTPAVARLVARLDGMPLAIELAAARVESLGLSQLLAKADQQVFRRLAIFPGGFTLEGAEAVAGPAAAAAVLQLVDCSLVSPPRPRPDGSSRYLMLETLREFGLVQLAKAGERANADAALAGYARRVLPLNTLAGRG